MADGRDEAEAALRAEASDLTHVTVRMATPVYDEVYRVAIARGTLLALSCLDRMRPFVTVRTERPRLLAL